MSEGAISERVSILEERQSRCQLMRENVEAHQTHLLESMAKDIKDLVRAIRGDNGTVGTIGHIAVLQTQVNALNNQIQECQTENRTLHNRITGLIWKLVGMGVIGSGSVAAAKFGGLLV